jgi:hypothetical protein
MVKKKGGTEPKEEVPKEDIEQLKEAFITEKNEWKVSALSFHDLLTND